MASFKTGEIDRARGLYKEAMALREQLQLPARQGLVAVSLSEIATIDGQLAAARQWLQKAAALALQTQSRYVGHHVVEQCAALAAADKEWSLGLRWFAASATQRQASGMSELTMSHKQRLDALERARGALGPRAAAAAQRGGSTLSYEEALEEVSEWLRTKDWLIASALA